MKDLLLASGAALIHGLLALFTLDPFGWPLGYLSFLPLLFLLHQFQRRPLWLFWSGLCCGLAYALIVTGWLLGTLVRFMEYSYLESLLDLLVYAIIYFLKYPVFLLLGSVAYKLRWLRPRWLWLALVAVGSEWSMPSLFKSHWGIAVDPYTLQTAELIGIYGLTFLLVCFSYFLFRMARMLLKARTGVWQSLKRDSFWKHAWPVPLLFASALCYGVFRKERLETHQLKLDTISVAVLQPNTRPSWLRSRERLSPEDLTELFYRTIPALAQEAAAQKPDLMVLPEGAIPYFSTENNPYTNDPAYPLYAPVFEQLVLGLVRDHNVDLLFNEDTRDPVRMGNRTAVKAFNAATFLDRRGKRSTYRKQALLPGEELPVLRYMELLDLQFVGNRFERLHRYWPGNSATVFTTTHPAKRTDADPKTYRDWTQLSPTELRLDLAERKALDYALIMPLICSEDLETLLPRQFFVQQRPQAMINLTQDGWYGDTFEPHQHAHYARIRAIETRRALVRATNSGISAAYGLTGELLPAFYGPLKSSVYTKSVQVFHVPLNPGSPTFYMRYGMLWYGCAWLVLLALILSAMRRRKRRLASQSESNR
ncbi:MAG: apolipoprotein N-acyltransferase [Spirochaetales bacterium]|nr:apolipoprotein N-acyltransferase [Spirochaetales bacterium]